MAELNSVELAALRCALAGSEHWREVLRSQLDVLEVRDRDYNDAGGFTTLAARAPVERASVPEDVKYQPPACVVTHPSLPHLGDFVVWLEDGLIVGLEATAHGDGRWPIEATASEFGFHTETPS